MPCQGLYGCSKNAVLSATRLPFLPNHGGEERHCDMAYASISPVPTRIPPGSRLVIGPAEPANQLGVHFR